MRRLALLALLLGTPAFATSAPTNLKVDCVGTIGDAYATTPHNCDQLAISFQWTCAGQTAYELEVNNKSTPGGSNAPYLSTSGSTATTVTFAGTLAAGWTQIPVKGTVLNYWRVRCNDGSGVSSYSTSSYSFETPPKPPASVAVVSGSGTGAISSYSAATPSTFYVATTGNDTTCTGAIGSPCATVAKVGTTFASAGSTIYIRAGSYSETFCVGASWPTATRSNPVTIAAFPGETVNFTSTTGASCSGDSGVIGLNKPFYVVDGIHFTSDGGSTLYVLLKGNNDVVKNCQFLGTTSTKGAVSAYTYTQVHASGDDEWILNNYFAASSCLGATGGEAAIHLQHIGDAIVRGNEFTGGYARSFKSDGGQSYAGNTLYLENYVHDLACANGGAVIVYEGGNLSMWRNLVIKASVDNYIRWSRSGWDNITSNTFFGAACADSNDHYGTGNKINSNICRGSNTASIWSNYLGFSEWDSVDHPVSTYNFWSSSTGCDATHRVWDGNSGTCSSTGNGYLGGGTGESLTDPNLTPTYKPQAGSASINAGDPTLPVPVGGGARADSGRYEFGAATIAANGTYSYQSQWTVSTTPLISWTFSDADNIAFTAGQTQSNYEIEIDTANTFDSAGTFHPLCRSGKVASSTASWDVPASCGLVAGNQYYFRIRTFDSVDATLPGVWSDYANAFTVTGGGGGQTCGNNVREGTELCDGTDIGTATCISQGYAGGVLGCAGTCLAFDTTFCTIATTQNSKAQGLKITGGAIH